MSNHEELRPVFEARTWNYYQGLKAKGWSSPEEGDTTIQEALFWRKQSGKYGVNQIEAAWWGFKLAQPARASGVPKDWSITREDSVAPIRVASPASGPGVTEVVPWDLSLNARMLYALCNALLPSAVRTREVDERATYEAHQFSQGWAESDLADKCAEGAPRAGEYRNQQLQDDWEIWQACCRAQRQYKA